MRTLHQNVSKMCVLGGTGFIGRHLLESFGARDGAQVKVLSRFKHENNHCRVCIHYNEGDMRNYDSLVQFLEPLSTAVNLAYLNIESSDDNIRAMEYLAKACIERGVARLIHLSTAVVVGNAKDDVITEETPCTPVSIYEKTKLRIEDMLVEILKGKCEVVILRPTAVFGPYGKNGLKLIDELISGAPLVRLIKASLYSRRRLNLVSVKNVVDSIMFFIDFVGDISGERFIISDDDAEENNYYDVSRLLSSHLGLKQVGMVDIPFQSFFLPALLRLRKRTNTNPNRIYSGHKLERVGLVKRNAFHDEIRRFALWYQEHQKTETYIR